MKHRSALFAVIRENLQEGTNLRIFGGSTVHTTQPKKWSAVLALEDTQVDLGHWEGLYIMGKLIKYVPCDTLIEPKEDLSPGNEVSVYWESGKRKFWNAIAANQSGEQAQKISTEAPPKKKSKTLPSKTLQKPPKCNISFGGWQYLQIHLFREQSHYGNSD